MNIRPIQTYRNQNVSFGIALGDRQTKQILTNIQTKIEENYQNDFRNHKNCVADSIKILENISGMTCFGEGEPTLYLKKYDAETIEGTLVKDNNKTSDFRMKFDKNYPLETLQRLQKILSFYTDDKKSNEESKAEKLISYIFNHSG